MNIPEPIISTQFFVGLQFGYIMVPPDVDRATFIEQCYRWERVSIVIEKGGGAIHDCYISRGALKDVTFPDKADQLGSCVSFLTDMQGAHPVIFGVYSKEDESQLLREGYFQFSKTYQGNSVMLTGDAIKGVMNLTVDGGTATQLNITVGNKAKDAAINIRCRGNVKLEMDGTFKINGGTQAMIKGDVLQTQLGNTNTYLTTDLYNALYAALQAIDAVVPGVSAAFQAALAGKSPGDYDDIKSSKAFID
jgi:hypothetical protein